MNYFRFIVLLIVLFIVQPIYSQCLKEPKVYLSPLKEIYTPNDTVKITFEFNYDRVDLNWLSAVEIKYSDSWTIIEPFSVPNNCCDSMSFWEWDIKTDSTGNKIQGFFFNDFRIYEVYGDNCLCEYCTFFTDHFTFSWTMYVNDCTTTGDLLLIIDTYGDSEVGTWWVSSCENDEIITIRKKKDCLTSCNKFGGLKN